MLKCSPSGGGSTLRVSDISLCFLSFIFMVLTHGLHCNRPQRAYSYHTFASIHVTFNMCIVLPYNQLVQPVQSGLSRTQASLAPHSWEPRPPTIPPGPCTTQTPSR